MSLSTRATTTPASAGQPSPTSTGSGASFATGASPSSSWPRRAPSSRRPGCSSTVSCPRASQLRSWSALFTEHEMLHEGLHHHFDGFPATGHPMAILSAMINAVGCYDPAFTEMETATSLSELGGPRLISKLRTIAAAAYKTSIGQPIIYPEAAAALRAQLPAHDVLHALRRTTRPTTDTIAAFSASSSCTPTTSRTARPARCAWWRRRGRTCTPVAPRGSARFGDRLHGGANEAVVEMLQYLYDNNVDPKDYLARGEDARTTPPGSWASAIGSTRTSTRGRSS